MGLFAGPCPRATRKKSLRQPTTAASARGVGHKRQRRASGLKKLARKRHTVHFRALRPSTIRARHAPRSPHFERMGKERIYPFLCQMAKVELEGVQRVTARTDHELADALRVCRPTGRLRGEALVVVEVAV